MPEDHRGYPRPMPGRPGYEIDIDVARLQLPVIHAFLTASYWAPGVTPGQVASRIAGADCFGLYFGPDQVGFARVISDRATLAWISDVFVLSPHRGQGLGRRLIKAVVAEPAYGDVLTWMLSTRDAHGLYAKLGFVPVDPAILMVRRSA